MEEEKKKGGKRKSHIGHEHDGDKPFSIFTKKKGGAPNFLLRITRLKPRTL